MAGSVRSGRGLGGSTVAIVGVGLLGGSLGLALDGHVARRIGVVEPGDAAAAEHALVREVVDEVLVLSEAVDAADLVVLATPVRTTLEMIPQVALHARGETLVIDLGSTKRAVVDAMCAAGGAGVTWVGMHPMCGGTGSVAEARADLFEGATWVACPSGGLIPSVLHELVQAVGSREALVGAEAHSHDAAAGLVSHVPYVLAQALVHALGRLGPTSELARDIAGRGWRGATRLAKGDVTMWHDVLRTNGANVAAELRTLARELDRVAELVERPGDDADDELGAWLTRGRALRRGPTDA